ncbi:g4530 [Coccomyxa viridis]|uniref:G4530 protein n=1 Tax=Coccomyxa viridis TaxID=1274662 RepID=A0ABP1FQH4_9CHLO
MSRSKRTPLSAQDKSKWRDKVREECLQRVKQHRQGVLWRMRQEGGNGLQEADVHSVLAGIIADVSSSSPAQASPEAASLGSPVAYGTPAPMMDEEDDWLSRPSTPQPASADPLAWLSRRDMPRENIVDAAQQLDESDYMQLMADMEQSFLDAMLQDEAAFLSHLEAQDIDSLVALHDETPSSSGGVQCPICRSTDLVERHGVVLCPAGDLRLDLRHEGMTLDHVRQRLAAAVEGHGQMGCLGRPSFGMESIAPGAGPTLVMRCNSCTCVHVVV